MSSEARTLLQAVDNLTNEVASLNQKFEQVNEDVYKTVRTMKVVIAVLVTVSLFSLGALAYAIYNGQKIAQVQERTSNEVLCPLYKLFLDSYRPEAQPPERRQAYEDAFKVIRKSYAVLECTK